MGTKRSKHNRGRKRLDYHDLNEADQRAAERAERRAIAKSQTPEAKEPGAKKARPPLVLDDTAGIKRVAQHYARKNWGHMLIDAELEDIVSEVYLACCDIPDKSESQIFMAIRKVLRDRMKIVRSEISHEMEGRFVDDTLLRDNSLYDRPRQHDYFGEYSRYIRLQMKDRQFEIVYVKQLLRALTNVDPEIIEMCADFASPLDFAKDKRCLLSDAVERFERVRRAAEDMDQEGGEARESKPAVRRRVVSGKRPVKTSRTRVHRASRGGYW